VSGLPPREPGCASCAARDELIAELLAQVEALGERVAGPGARGIAEQRELVDAACLG